MMNKAVRLDKFLANAGKGTRSEVKQYIKKGQVTVNGSVVKSPERKITEADHIVLSGEEITAAPEYVYYILNKPAGYVSATEDKHDPTVMELIPSERKGLFPVGRLDKDTEGLLLITDDGILAHELLSPKKHVDKTYFVRARGEITEEKRKMLEQGVEIGEEHLTLPAKAEIVSEEKKSGDCPDDCFELLLTIREGKFHQVKRMLHAVGSEVVYLKRLSMGPLTLPRDLEKGESRPLTEEERKSLGK